MHTKPKMGCTVVKIIAQIHDISIIKCSERGAVAIIVNNFTKVDVYCNMSKYFPCKNIKG